MQTNPHASLQPLPLPRLPGRGPSDDDKPTCGGVLPVFLSVGFHGALKKKKGILQKIMRGGGRREFRNVLRKSTRANLLVTFQWALLLLSLFDDDVTFFFSMMQKIATKTFWKIWPNVSPVFLSFVGPSMVHSGRVGSYSRFWGQASCLAENPLVYKCISKRPEPVETRCLAGGGARCVFDTDYKLLRAGIWPFISMSPVLRTAETLKLLVE